MSYYFENGVLNVVLTYDKENGELFQNIMCKDCIDKINPEFTEVKDILPLTPYLCSCMDLMEEPECEMSFCSHNYR
jgi:hypothetical protein